MTEPLIIEMPLPSPHSGGNKRGHWIHGYRTKRAEKQRMLLTLRTNDLENLLLTPVDITIDWYGWNKVDRDNALSRCKGYIDGLIQARLIPDDGPDHVHSLSVREVAIDRKNQRVLFTIQEASS